MLHKAEKDKEAAALKPWIPSTINNFWYSCKIANGDTEKLKDCWFGVVHHVCREHTWSGSACLHGPSTSSEPKQVLEKKSKPAEALRAVVFDRKFLTNLEMCTIFRHTGSIETFNSMLTKYQKGLLLNIYICLPHGFGCNRPLYASPQMGWEGNF